MNPIIAIAAGGASGALARFWLANLIYDYLGRGFPHGTLFVNVTGSFLMGILTELMLQRFPATPEYRSAVLIGFLGAYTTFSTFALDTHYLFEQGQALKALLNILLSVTLCLTAVWLGLLLGRKLFTGEFMPWLSDGLPWGIILIHLIAALALGMVAELSFKYWQLSPATQMLMLIALLGITTTASAMSIALKLPPLSHDLPGMFVLSALGSAVLMWIGITLGKQIAG